MENLPRSKYNIIAPPERANLVWLGANMWVASEDTNWINQWDYQQKGSSVAYFMG